MHMYLLWFTYIPLLFSFPKYNSGLKINNTEHGSESLSTKSRSRSKVPTYKIGSYLSRNRITSENRERTNGQWQGNSKEYSFNSINNANKNDSPCHIISFKNERQSYTRQLTIDRTESAQWKLCNRNDGIIQNNHLGTSFVQDKTGTDKKFGRSLKKNRRFLSNLKKKLKEHLKKAKEWKLSRKEAKKLFDKYNKCLMTKVKEILKEDFPIEAFMAIEGEKVAFNCSVCYRPDKDKESQRAKWQVLRHEDTALKEVKRKGKFKITKENTLIIKDIDVTDAGQYFCVEKRDYAAIYQLDVFLTDRRKHVKQGAEKPQGETLLVERNLRVFTMWAPWGDCNTCGKEGYKLRVGQCTVQKIYTDAPVFPRDYPLMALYPEGIPCHSTALPRHIRKLSEIGLRYSETLISPCKQPCPTEPPAKMITDEDGKVVEVVESGFHSMKNKPKLPPLVRRKVLYEQEKSHLVLHCPGDLDAKLIRWAKGKREVDPTSIKRQTQGRVWLDTLTRLHLKPLMLSDTAVYNLNYHGPVLDAMAMLVKKTASSLRFLKRANEEFVHLVVTKKYM